MNFMNNNFYPAAIRTFNIASWEYIFTNLRKGSFVRWMKSLPLRTWCPLFLIMMYVILENCFYNEGLFVLWHLWNLLFEKHPVRWKREGRIKLSLTHNVVYFNLISMNNYQTLCISRMTQYNECKNMQCGRS